MVLCWFDIGDGIAAQFGVDGRGLGGASISEIFRLIWCCAGLILAMG